MLEVCRLPKHSYTVGDACVPTSLGNSALLRVNVSHPNPVTTANLNLQLANDENRVTLFNAMGEMEFLIEKHLLLM